MARGSRVGCCFGIWTGLVYMWQELFSNGERTSNGRGNRSESEIVQNVQSGARDITDHVESTSNSEQMGHPSNGMPGIISKIFSDVQEGDSTDMLTTGSGGAGPSQICKPLSPNVGEECGENEQQKVISDVQEGDSTDILTTGSGGAGASQICEPLSPDVGEEYGENEQQKAINRADIVRTYISSSDSDTAIELDEKEAHEGITDDEGAAYEELGAIAVGREVDDDLDRFADVDVELELIAPKFPREAMTYVAHVSTGEGENESTVTAKMEIDSDSDTEGLHWAEFPMSDIPVDGQKITYYFEIVDYTTEDGRHFAWETGPKRVATVSGKDKKTASFRETPRGWA